MLPAAILGTFVGRGVGYYAWGKHAADRENEFLRRLLGLSGLQDASLPESERRAAFIDYYNNNFIEFKAAPDGVALPGLQKSIRLVGQEKLPKEGLIVGGTDCDAVRSAAPGTSVCVSPSSILTPPTTTEFVAVRLVGSPPGLIHAGAALGSLVYLVLRAAKR